MQTITTHYKNGRVYAKCWQGWVKTDFDSALNSESNHRAVAEKMVKKLNAGRNDVAFEIKAGAPSVGDGWTFLIDYKHVSKMSITVKFKPSTNSGPAYMRAYSWLFPKGVKVNYSPKVADGSDIQSNARYAASVMLDMINKRCSDDGAPLSWKLVDYVELFDGDRLFTLSAV